MEINYSSQLGRFTRDKWAMLWWVRENKVSPASLASISTPLRFPHANRNTLTYFVSSHKKGILCKIICYSHRLLSVCLSLFSIKPTPTLKSHKVAGLLGLPSDDAYAGLHAQYALHEKQPAHQTSVFRQGFSFLRTLKHMSLTFTKSKYSGFIFSPPSLTGMRMMTARSSGGGEADDGRSSGGREGLSDVSSEACPALGALWQSMTSALYTVKDQ